jgi:hypothetical protein
MSTEYYISKNEDTYVPAARLDNVLVKIQGDASSQELVTFELRSCDDGTVIDDRQQFYIDIISRNKLAEYPATDHCPIILTVGGFKFAHISLDNSMRSATAGHGLCTRLVGIMRVVENIDADVVFFSKACRKLFTSNGMPWVHCRRFIENTGKLHFIGEHADDYDISGMAFGIAAFAKQRFIDHGYDCIIPAKLIPDGFGSAALGIRLSDKSIIWAVHMPLDFAPICESNKNIRAMNSLCKLMDDTSMGNSICAFGDFNTIPDHTDIPMTDVATSYGYRFLNNELTFFGSYYDTVKGTDNIVPLGLSISCECNEKLPPSTEESIN